MQRFWDVAAPMTWVILTLASVLLMAGFVLLSHMWLQRKAFGDSYRGLLDPAPFGRALRLGLAALLAGLALSAYELGGPGWLTAGLGALTVASLAAQAIAAVGRSGQRAEESKRRPQR